MVPPPPPMTEVNEFLTSEAPPPPFEDKEREQQKKTVLPSPPTTEVNEFPASEAPPPPFKDKEGETKEKEKQIVPPPPPTTEVNEFLASEAPPPPFKDKEGETKEKEKQVDKKPLLMASLNPETVMTTQREDPPELLPSSSRSPSAEEVKKQVAHYPPLSDGEVDFIHPMYAKNPKPLYPREARKKGFQGEVVLKVEVLSNGFVGHVEVKKSSGHEILDHSALSTVKQWKFIPAKWGEITVSSWVNIPVKFQLQ